MARKPQKKNGTHYAKHWNVKNVKKNLKFLTVKETENTVQLTVLIKTNIM